VTDAAGPRFDTVAEIRCDVARASVFEHGWQSWSPSGIYPATATSRRPVDATTGTIGYRPGRPAPATGFQGEGLIAVDTADGSIRLLAAPRPDLAVPSIRVRAEGTGLLVASADGEVCDTSVSGPLGTALADWAATVAARAGAGPVRPLPSVWCSWYCYWEHVTAQDIRTNLAAVDRLGLDVSIVQVDDGWSAAVGDWLTVHPRFGDLADLAARITGSGRRAGIWVAPFLAGADSALAADHPQWLVRDADAGHNWDQDLYALDVTHPEAAAYLQDVFATLAGYGFDYFKLDFLYAGALAGGRQCDAEPLAAYRHGMDLIRRALPAGATIVGSGAPVLPSIGLVEGMRVSTDVARPGLLEADARMATAAATGCARSFQHGRWWVNDPDCLLLRPEVPHRRRWAGHVERSGGLRALSDPIAALDSWGLASARRLLGPSAPGPVDLVDRSRLAGPPWRS
jgi:alpha-galactosidase